MSNSRQVLVTPPTEHVEIVRQAIRELGVEETAKSMGLDRRTVLKIASGCMKVHKLTSLYLEDWCNAQRAA